MVSGAKRFLDAETVVNAVTAAETKEDALTKATTHNFTAPTATIKYTQT